MLNPTLRALEISRFDDENEEYFLFHDRENLAPDVALSTRLAPILALLDGLHSADEIFHLCSREENTFPRSWFDELLESLRSHLLLESPQVKALRVQKSAEFNRQTVRFCAFAGRSYPRDAAQLRNFLELKQREGNKRLPSFTFDAATVCGIVTPHIDFTRGGHVEAASFAPLLQNVQATGQAFDTLVVMGIAHCGVRFPFCGLKQHLQTPLGLQICDRDFVNDLENALGARFLNEQIAHKDEHSVEFASVFCLFFDELKAAQVVPILCGGLWESLGSQQFPEQTQPEVAEFVAALRGVVALHEALGKKIGFIASVDGAHVGTPFGDASPLTRAKLHAISEADRVWCAAIEAGDRAEFHRHFASDGNRFNVDAHPALYTLMAAFPEWRAQWLDYDQAVDLKANSVVSFASLALFQPADMASPL